MTGCAICDAPAVLSAYWKDELTLCGPCAASLATDLDAEDLWPPVEIPVATTGVGLDGAPGSAGLRCELVAEEESHPLAAVVCSRCGGRGPVARHPESNDWRCQDCWHVPWQEEPR
jgi:hypothetical protein